MKKKNERAKISTGGEGPLSLSIGEASGLAAPTAKNESAKAPPAEREADAAREKSADSGRRVSSAVLQRSRSGGGKWVTRILLKPQHDAAALEAIAAEARRALGTGSRVENGAIVLQGDIPDRAGDWLKKRGVTKITK